MRAAVVAALLGAIVLAGCWLAPRCAPEALEGPACVCERDDIGEHNCVCPEE